jgi:hypothetical protein
MGRDCAEKICELVHLCLADELIVLGLCELQPCAKGHGLSLAVLQAALQQLQLGLELGELVCLLTYLQGCAASTCKRESTVPVG